MMVKLGADRSSDNQQGVSHTAGSGQPVQQRIDKTYTQNCQSHYTEAIEALDAQFSYEANRHHFWSEPQQSVLYGTPFYEQASATQKLALNHLYWIFAYTATAAAEMQTVMFNQVTAGVFGQLGGLDTLYQELELETHQEKSHIHAFNTIIQKTATPLLGRRVFAKLLKKPPQPPSILARCQGGLDQRLHGIARTLLRQHRGVYSPYLAQWNDKPGGIPAPTTGFGYLGSGVLSQSILRYVIVSWGASPFLASQYYNVRYMANLLLKNREHRVFRYHRQLQQQGAFIPAPTAVSYYHMLDEAYHTTMSQVIGRDLYRDLPPPTAYEKWVANGSIYLVQYKSLQGLNAGIPGLYLADELFFMGFLYRLLQLPVFGLSWQEALQVIEQSFGQEHEGLQIAAKWHRWLLKEYQRFFSGFDYLWRINRTMGLMAAGGQIDRVLARNRRVFRQFAQTLAAEA